MKQSNPQVGGRCSGQVDSETEALLRPPAATAAVTTATATVTTTTATLGLGPGLVHGQGSTVNLSLGGVGLMAPVEKPGAVNVLSAAP